MTELSAPIDPLLVPVVKKLNAAGLDTIYSCQGNHHTDRLPNIAYICFAPGVQLPPKIKGAVAEFGWQLDKFHRGNEEEPCLAIYSVMSDFEFDASRLRECNDKFIEGWLKILP